MTRPSPELPESGTRRPGERAALAPKFEGECVEFFSEVVQVFGVAPSVGQIYGLLYASPAPLSFSDIVERLEISKGSASQGLQFLRSIGAVRSVSSVDGDSIPRRPSSNISPPATGHRHPSSISPPSTGHRRPSSDISPPSTVLRPQESDVKRRDYYEPELSLRKLMSGVLHERVAPLAATGSDRVGRLRELAAGGDGPKDFYLDRVKQLETWRRRLKTVLPVLTTLLGPKRKQG
jgi:hypothetical protein